MFSLIFKVNDYLAVLVKVNPIPDLSTLMGRLWGGLRRRLMFSRQPYVRWRVDPCNDVKTALFQFQANPNTGTVLGQVSQSCQFAVSSSADVLSSKLMYPPQPFNHEYIWQNQTYSIINDPTVTVLNPYRGGVFQQAVSSLTNTNTTAYELNGGDFSVYGYEYKPGTDNAVCTLSHAMPS